VPENNRQDNLERLCREIQDMHRSLSSPADSPRNKLCRRLADRMPYCHSTGTKAFAGICQSKSILSLTRLDAIESQDWSHHPIETQLETRDSVFLFAGPFRYPDTAYGFLFSPDLADDRATDGSASPFDSGGLVDHHLPPSSEKPLDFLRRHEMPIPQYRKFHLLVLDLLFHDPWHYVGGVDPVRQGPVRLAVGDSDPRRWTFEIRLRNELPFRPHLQAVFNSTFAAKSNSVVKTHSWCRANGVDIIQYPDLHGSRKGSFMEMQRRCEAYIRSHLGK